MNVETYPLVYKKAIETFGIEPQRKTAIEEMAELINAMMKYDRGRNTKDDIIEEIADVTIMMQQLAIIYGQEEVQQQIDFKTNRLANKLKEKGVEIDDTSNQGDELLAQEAAKYVLNTYYNETPGFNELVETYIAGAKSYGKQIKNNTL
jgi:NTP pyrophosphatase (non-canonical NTP hydrolase)